MTTMTVQFEHGSLVRSLCNLKRNIMKKQWMMSLAVALALVAVPGLQAADKAPDGKAKAYPLKTCVVSDEEIGKDADMKPHVFVHKGQEVKLCCKSCLKDFNKDPEKYMKKIHDAEKK